MEVERRKSDGNYQYFNQFAVFEFDKEVITYEQVATEGSGRFVGYSWCYVVSSDGRRKVQEF